MLIIGIENKNKSNILYYKAIKLLEHMILLNSNNSSKIEPLSPINVQTKMKRISSFTTNDDSTTVDNADTFSWNSGNPFYEDQFYQDKAF